MQSADPLASLQPVDTKTARWLNHRKRFVKLHRFHCQSLQTRVFTEAEALESRRGCGIADLDVCYTAGIFPDLVQKHQKHCKEAALPRSMTVMNHAHTCATHWASGDSPKSRSPNSRAAWVFVSKSCEVMTRMRDLAFYILLWSLQHFAVARTLWCWVVRCKIGATWCKQFRAVSFHWASSGWQYTGAITSTQKMKRGCPQERLSSTDSKSSQCDSDHKQSFLYSWDCWEMSCHWFDHKVRRNVNRLVERFCTKSFKSYIIYIYTIINSLSHFVHADAFTASTTALEVFNASCRIKAWSLVPMALTCLHWNNHASKVNNGGECSQYRFNIAWISHQTGQYLYWPNTAECSYSSCYWLSLVWSVFCNQTQHSWAMTTHLMAKWGRCTRFKS